MTLRGVALLLGGLALGTTGWQVGWPELTALGAAAVVLVIAVALTLPHTGKVEVTIDSNSVRVVRGEPAAVKVAIASTGRRRALRMVEGAPDKPRRTVVVPGGRASVTLDFPVSTERRGLHPLGPFTVVRGDPWSVWRTSVTRVPEGSLLVRPRTFPVRRGFTAALRQGDSESLTRRRGDDHFFALRDYVLGDEPRNVHWRSSARSGRLVVRQKVAAATEGTLLVLDTDATAYASGEAFSGGFLEERFEAAVEVFASLCVASGSDGHTLHIATTSLRQPSIKPGTSVAGFIDALAVVSAATPVETSPAEIAAIARRTRCSHLIVVSGTPGPDLLAAIRRCGSLEPVLVRVAAAPAAPVQGATTLDVIDAQALS